MKYVVRRRWLLCSPARIRLQLVDKAVSREKERIRSDEKKAKRRAKAFMDYLLHDIEPALRASDTWEKVRPRYATWAAFLHIPAILCKWLSFLRDVFEVENAWGRLVYFRYLPAVKCRTLSVG